MDYMTIAEFAAAAGVSRQTIYNRIAKDLSSYCLTVEGKRVIDAAALSLFRSNEPVHGPEPEPQPEGGAAAADVIAALNARIEDKDKEIAYLRELLDKVTDNNAELQRNYQYLLGQQKALELSNGSKTLDSELKDIGQTVDSNRKISLFQKVKRFFTT